MSTKKEKTKKTYKVRKVGVWQSLLLVSCGLIFIVALASSILFDKVFACNLLCDSSIGVVCQVVATIASCLASIIAISMSLQNDVCFGIPVKKFNNLRVGFHFSISNILIVSIILLLINVAFYVTDLLIASIGTALVEVIFCLYLSVVEIPIMAKKEKSLLHIVKKRLQFEQTTVGDIPKDLKDVLKYLISEEKNLTVTYNLLKSKDEKFNTYLLLNLLGVQSDLASEVKQIQDVQKKQNIIDAIIRNITDIFLFKKDFDISEILKDNLTDYDYVISRTLYKLHNKQLATDIGSNDKVCGFVASWVVGLRGDKISESKTDFIVTTLLSVLSTSIAKNDFAFISALRRELSIYNFALSHLSGCALIFSLISMQMFYLYSGAHGVTSEHKSNISDFLNCSGLSDNVKILSWKVLYNEFLRAYAIEFKDFWHFFKLNKDRWDVPLLGTQMYLVTLDFEFVLKWYLFNLLCSARASKYDYEQLKLKEMAMYDYALENILDSLFDQDSEIIIPDQMRRIIEFYGIKTSGLNLFKAVERNERNLFKFKNKIHTKDFDDKIQKAKAADKDEVCKKFHSQVVKKLQEEWGFDNSLRIDGRPQQAHIIIEKTSDAINFDEVVVDYFVRSILMEVRGRVCASTIKKDEKFDSEISKLLKKRIYAISEQSQYSISFNLSDAKIREQFDNEVQNAEKFDSHILVGDYLLLSKAFKFNFEFIEFRAMNLTEEQISAQVETYKRADGQYTFEGAFLSREQIEEYVKNQFIVISICLKLQVESWKELLYEINLYDDEEEEVKEDDKNENEDESGDNEFNDRPDKK